MNRCHSYNVLQTSSISPCICDRLAGGLIWVGVLTFGVLSEQIKTRIEQADEAKSSRVCMYICIFPLHAHLIPESSTETPHQHERVLYDRSSHKVTRLPCPVASSTQISKWVAGHQCKRVTLWSSISGRASHFHLLFIFLKVQHISC